MGLNRVHDIELALVISYVRAGPNVVDLALCFGRRARTDLNKVKDKRVRVKVVPVDGDRTEETTIMSLLSAEDLNLIASASLYADCLLA